MITPHVYPPSITGATFLGKDLWEQSRTAFGYLQNPGYCGGPMLQTKGEDPAATASTAATRLRRLLSSSDGSLSGTGSILGSTAGRVRKMLEDWGIIRAGLSSVRRVPAVVEDEVQADAAAEEEQQADADAVVEQQQAAAACTVFPVVIGETGSNFASATDRQWLQDFADYIMASVSVLTDTWGALSVRERGEAAMQAGRGRGGRQGGREGGVL